MGCQPQTEGQGAFTRPGKAELIHGIHGTWRNDCQLHFPPPRFLPIPASPTLAQSYLKTRQKCPNQMAHPRPKEAREQLAEGPKKQVKCARSLSESWSHCVLSSGCSCLCSTLSLMLCTAPAQDIYWVSKGTQGREGPGSVRTNDSSDPENCSVCHWASNRSLSLLLSSEGWDLTSCILPANPDLATMPPPDSVWDPRDPEACCTPAPLRDIATFHSDPYTSPPVPLT